MEERTASSLLSCLQLRHPNVLSFKDTAELDERGETIIYLVTEPVTALLEVLQSLDVTGPARCALGSTVHSSAKAHASYSA